MKTAILPLIFLLSSFSAFATDAVFNEYSFEYGGYSILGTFWGGADENSLCDSLGEFFTDDIALLNQFKKDWVFKKKGNAYACGYHYEVFLCKGGEVVESMSINLNCEEIVTGEGYFYFDPNLLRQFYGKLKRPASKRMTFTSVSEARDYRSKTLSDSTLIMVNTPDWTRFEGEFDFTYTCPEGTKTCMEQEERLKKEMEAEIRKTYPGEDFELRDRGGSLTEIFQTVHCNKTLSDKFNLYSRDTSGYFGKWKPCELKLTTYWTIYPK